MSLDRGRIDAILDAAADALEGDWLLVGGAAAAAWFLPERVTEDVDLVSLRGSQEDRLALLALADRLGLSPEAFNSAADFFVHRIPGWTAEMEPLRRGRGARIHRPTVTLFVLLKLGRLSEVDLGDCLALLGYVRDAGGSWDRGRLIAALDALPAPTDAALLDRRRALRGARVGTDSPFHLKSGPRLPLLPTGCKKGEKLSPSPPHPAARSPTATT